MASIDLPSSPLAITVILLVMYAFSLFKLATKTLPDLHIWLAGHGIGDGKQLFKSINSIDAVSSQEPAVTIKTEPTFSPDWWYHDHIFQLERRAIFSKSWIYATHRSCFTKPGDYTTFHIAGFSFFLILGKDNLLRAFHNVCRHRAYEVTRKQRGSSTILGCRYHGWSYNTKGQLTKAPEFDTVPEFDKEKNGLWEIHLEISAQGLVFVNLDAAKSVVSLTLEELDTGADVRNMARSKKVAEWRYEGGFNWKLAITSNSSDNNTVRIFEDISDRSSGIFSRIFRQKRQLHVRADLATSISLYPAEAIWLVVKIMPQSAMKTTLEYELYAWATLESPFIESSAKKLKETTFAEIERLQALHKRLIEGNLYLEDVQLDEQNAIHSLLVEHRKLERSEGMEIRPAARQISLSEKGQEDVDLCKALEKASVNTGPIITKPSSSSLAGSLDW